MAGEKKIILVAQKDGAFDAPLFDDLFKVATIAKYPSAHKTAGWNC